ncbi:MAG: TolC family protein [Thermoanaerobaculia bacterium]
MSRSVLRIALAFALSTGASAAQEALDHHPVLAPARAEEAIYSDPSEADPFAAADRLERARLIRAVLDRNPNLEAARQAWRSALERVPQAASLTDPTLSYSFSPLSVGDDEVRYGQILRFGQRLPFPGKRSLRGEIARAEADAALLGYESTRLDLAALASVLFDDYYLIHRALEINEEHLRLLEDFQRIATARYAAGTAPQQDPLQAEVEVARLLHRRVVLGTSRDILVAQLNALLHRRPELSLPPPPLELPRPGMDGLDPSQLQEQAVASRPELLALEAEMRARKSTVELRELDSYPDFEATGSFNSMWNQSEHRWMVGVGINLPMRRKRIRASVAEAEAGLRQIESDRSRLEDEIRAGVRIAYQRLEEAHHVVELYLSRVLPATRDQVNAALAGFKTGGNSYLALIEAEKNQRTARLEYEEALASSYSRRAELDRQIGRLPATNGSLTATGTEDSPTNPAGRQGDS